MATTNGLPNGAPKINGDPQLNGAPAPRKPVQPDDAPQANGLTHNPKATSHDRKLSSYAAKHKLAPHFIGGNHLNVAPASSVKDFVANHDGHTVITNVGAFLPACPRGVANEHFSGSHCQQRYCSSQGNPLRQKMGIRDLRRRAGHTIHRHGNPRGLASKCRLHPNGRSIRRSMAPLRSL